MPLPLYRTAPFTAAQSLGELLRKHRTDRRLSQLALAGITGIAAPVISNIESGKTKNPGILTLAPLLVALGVDPVRVMAACASPHIYEIEADAEDLADAPH